MDISKDMHVKECAGWLWRASKGIHGSVSWSALAGIVNVTVSLTFIYVCKHLIDIVTGHSDDELSVYVGLMFGCIAMQMLLSVVKGRLESRLEIRFRNRLRDKLFAHLMSTQWTGRDSLHTGDMLNRLEEDVMTVSDAVCRTVSSVIVTLFRLAGAMFILSSLDVRLACVLFFIMPLALLFSKSYMRRMRRLTRDIRSTDSRVQSLLQEHLQHRILIRTLEYTDRATGLLGRLQGDLQRLFDRRTDFSIFSRLMVRIGFAVGYATAFLWGIYGLRDGTVTFGMMAAFLQLVSQIQNPIVELSRKIPSFIRVFTSTERLAELTDMPLEQQGESQRLEGEIGVRFVDVTFRYPEGKRDVLAGFSHDFMPGSLTAIVGETGAGKSTMMRLMLALLLPGKGKVTFYNGSREITASPLTRCNVSYVPQGNTLLSGTIRDNLLMGNPDATDEEMLEACKLAQADEFIQQFPDKYDTWIEQGGSNVSGGQKQRLCIARALMKKPKILILDDSTSAVDTRTDALIRQGFREFIPETTKIIIAQRVASVEDADRIIVMDGGRISAIGNHEELMKTSEIYREVYTSQNKAGEQNGEE